MHFSWIIYSENVKELPQVTYFCRQKQLTFRLVRPLTAFAELPYRGEPDAGHGLVLSLLANGSYCRLWRRIGLAPLERGAGAAGD